MPKFEPYVRYAKKTTYYIGDRNLMARDCHILYIISGKGTFELGGKRIKLAPMTMIYYPYGEVYRISADSDILFYTVNFDFCQGGGNISTMVPQNAELYKKPIESLSSAPSGIFAKGMVFTAAGWAENAMRSICEEAKNQMRYHSQISSAYIKMLCYEMMRHTGESDVPLCRKIKQLVCENISLNNTQVAHILGYHPYYISEAFRQSEGITLHKYIVKQRLMLAYDKIASSKLTLDEIARQCGFSSLAHLSSTFKDFYGFPPNKLRKQ